MKRIGIKDVAKKANVSAAAVSYVFSGKGRVSNETRERVLEAAQALGYIRNDTAARLRSGESKLIGVILNNIVNPFFSELVASLEATVHAAGKLALLATAQNDPRRQERLVASMVSQGVNSIILSPVHGTTPADLSAAVDHGVPVVLCVRDVQDSGLAFVGVDDVMCGYLAAKRLLAAGHTSMMFIGGYAETTTWQGRADGIRRALREANVPIEACVMFPGVLNPDFAAEKLQRQSEMGLMPKAVICFNDDQASGAYRVARKLGLRVGRDISVIAFDNIPQGRILEPELTTVDIKPSMIGRISAEIAVSSRALTPARREVLSPQLIERGSICKS